MIDGKFKGRSFTAPALFLFLMNQTGDKRMNSTVIVADVDRVDAAYAALRTFIMYQMETDPLPRRILEALREHDGKPLTMRHINKFKAEISESIYLRKCYGMTHIGWGNYRQTDAKEGGELLIAHTEKGVVIDAEKIEHELNGRYFRAADSRNLSRTLLLADESLKLRDLAKSMIAFHDAHESVNKALKRVDSCDKWSLLKEFSRLSMDLIK